MQWKTRPDAKGWYWVYRGSLSELVIQFFSSEPDVIYHNKEIQFWGPLSPPRLPGPEPWSGITGAQQDPFKSEERDEH